MRISAKRAIDLIVASVTLTMLAPLLVLLAIAIRIMLGRPVFFRQVRPGLKGKPFTLIKFRSMLDARDRNRAPLPDSERLPWFGHFLRASSLDELPELLNVLAGDMSLVGPRPLLMQYLARYTPEQMRRHDVLPGITGWAQVNGRNRISWEEKFRLDIWYVDHQNLLLDARIIALTIWNVVRREGISQENHATMEEFLPDSSRVARSRDSEAAAR